MECKTQYCIIEKNYILRFKKSKKDKTGVWDTEGLYTLASLECSEEGSDAPGNFPIGLQTLTNIGIVPAGTSAALTSLRASWKAITPSVKRLCNLCLYSCKYLPIITIECLPKHNDCKKLSAELFCGSFSILKLLNVKVCPRQYIGWEFLAIVV